MPYSLNRFAFITLYTLYFTNFILESKYLPCNPKDFGHGSVVCQCTDDYCDKFMGMPNITDRQFIAYISTKDGMRFNESLGNISPVIGNKKREDVTLKLSVNISQSFQTILGFGGAFTDAATMNIFNLSSSLQEHIFNGYFASNGIEYSIGRVPMASCDFSTHVYSYDDFESDFSLTNFSLAYEDTHFKIPAILIANKISKHKINLFGSPWAAPGWMKTNHQMQHPGSLIGKPGDKYHETWASYFVKFLKAYERHGIDFWGLTVENEPNAGFLPSYSFQCMGFTDETERDFIKKDLGPALHANGYGSLKLMMLDDQRLFVPSWANTILSDLDAKQYVSGIGVHWYEDAFVPPTFLDTAHAMFPDTFILHTEACAGFTGPQQGVLLGSWERGEEYGHSILTYLNHWSIGWTDWNLVLNMQGGPNWVKNFVDSPIIADHEKGVFYKQPTFYFMGHFSKFVQPGSVKVGVTADRSTKLQYIAFLTKNKIRVLIIINKQDQKEVVDIFEPNIGHIMADVPARSIQTFVWK